MRHQPGRGWHVARDYATHAAIGGAFLVLTGFAPEEWLARVVHAVHLPDGALHLWTAGIDLRVAAVVVGMTVIVGDLVWRKHTAHLALAHSATESAATEVAIASPVAAQQDHASAPPPLPISYCRTPDGVRLAYAKIGTGPVLVRAGHWFSHLQLEWEDPGRRAALLRLGKGRTLVC